MPNFDSTCLFITSTIGADSYAQTHSLATDFILAEAIVEKYIRNFGDYTTLEAGYYEDDVALSDEVMGRRLVEDIKEYLEDDASIEFIVFLGFDLPPEVLSFLQSSGVEHSTIFFGGKSRIASDAWRKLLKSEPPQAVIHQCSDTCTASDMKELISHLGGFGIFSDCDENTEFVKEPTGWALVGEECDEITSLRSVLAAVQEISKALNLEEKDPVCKNRTKRPGEILFIPSLNFSFHLTLQGAG